MIPINERKLVLKWDEKNKTQQEIAELLGCHQTSISRLLSKQPILCCKHKTDWGTYSPRNW